MPRSKRPAAHFLDLDQIQHIEATAWDLAEHDRPAFANALRVSVQIATGLRVAELHALKPADVEQRYDAETGRLAPTGWLNVRRGKGCKPRRTVFLDGGPHSPTLATLVRYMGGEWRARARPIQADETLWPSGPHAYSHWVVHRLGPASGLQRRIDVLDAADPARAPPRYLIRTHLFRACFVIMARRLPQRHGLLPVEWDTIARWLGHESADMTRKRYWYADEEEDMAELRLKMPVGGLRAAAVAPRVNFTWRRGR